MVLPETNGGSIEAQVSVTERYQAQQSPPFSTPKAPTLPWTSADILLLIVLLVIASALRLVRLDEPAAVVFDETYYAKDACLYVGGDMEFCDSPGATEQSWVHPPLGKWLIAAGVKIFGYGPFGWRVASAVAGTALVGVAFLLARKLFKDRWVAAAAGLLVATDFLMIVQSRIAMLDVFLALFVLVGFLFLAHDREGFLEVREHLRLPYPAGSAQQARLEWRFAAGLAFGMAIAVKWSAAWALVAAIFAAISWAGAVARLQRKTLADEPSRPRAFWLVRDLCLTSLALGFVPLLIYLLSYGLWFTDNYHDAGIEHISGFSCNSPQRTGDDFADLQMQMFCYHTQLKAEHGYASKAWTWPLVLRPVAYYYEAEPNSRHVMAFGNPLVWYPALLSGLWLLLRSIRAWRTERLLLSAWLFQYLPWVFVARPLFFFYMTPIAPFMMIGLAGGLGAFRELGRTPRRLVAAYFVLGVGVALWYFYPVIAAVGLPYEAWYSRMWFKGRWI